MVWDWDFLEWLVKGVGGDRDSRSPEDWCSSSIHWSPPIRSSHQPGSGACRAQQMELSKPSTPHAAASHLAVVGCRMAAHRVQTIEACELSTRRRPTPGRSRMPDGGPQSADGEVVEASELTTRATAPHPAGAGCRTAVHRMQMMELADKISGLPGSYEAMFDSHIYMFYNLKEIRTCTHLKFQRPLH